MRSALVRLSHQSSALATIQLRCQSQVTGTSWLAEDKQDWSTAPTVQSLAKLQKKKLQEHQQKAESAPRVAFDDSHKTNTKAEGISRAMNYYMQKLSERGSQIGPFCLITASYAYLMILRYDLAQHSLQFKVQTP